MKRITQEETKNYRPLQQGYLNRNGMYHAAAFTLTPIPNEPGWEQVTYYGKRFVDPLRDDSSNRPHYVYVLINPSIPGICKIGYTTTTIYQRVNEINKATGVMLDWEPTFAYKCPDGRALERDVHEYLATRGVRINKRREGFAIDSDSARAIIEKLGKKYKISEENE
jgi:hypothetical protein